MVNSPLIRPYLLGWGGGGSLGSHEMGDEMMFHLMTCGAILHESFL